MPGLTTLIRDLLDTQMLSPHGICLLWRPELLWLHAGSDTLIGLSYFSIPLALGMFLHQRRDVRFSWAVWLFVAFIMLCGFTHFLMVVTLWKPIYGIEGLVKAATAVASLVTAAALWPLLPKVVAIPSTSELHARIAERDQALEELRLAMAQMVRLEEHQRDLSGALDLAYESEAKFRSVFDNAAVGIGRVDLDGRFLEVNDAFCAIAGWSRGELLDGGFQQITHPEDLEADLEQVAGLLEGRMTSYTLEKRYVRKDRTSVWIKLTCSLARGTGGKPGHFVAIIEDITVQKHTEAARDLLMREIDHRARNVLAVMQSVVRLTPAENPAAFKQAVIGRIDAMARAQGALARNSWSGGSLDQVAREELGSAAPQGQWEVRGQGVRLPPAAVQPLSMILHELATNALKYGALSAAAGRVEVECGLGPSGGWRMLWRETGGPPAGPPQRLGFGSKLIDRLCRELQGAVSYAWEETGLVVEVEGAEAQAAA